MILRKYKPTDCEQIAKLFYETVHTVNAKDYTESQLHAWANGYVDLDIWNKTLTEHYTVVAVENDLIVGFGDIDHTGYLDKLYVHKDYQRKGIATAICNLLESHSSFKDITVHASITAKPFFTERGYTIIKKQEVLRNGISLTNFIMKKS